MNIRNPILAAALEEINKEAQSVEAVAPNTDSQADVTTTSVENVDAVAQLQNEVEVHQNEKFESDIVDIEANGEAVNDDLEEAVDAVASLEQFAQLAHAAAASGNSSKFLNASLSLGIENICASIGYPSIVAALEAESTNVSDVKDVSRSLGDRAKAAAESIKKGLIAFIKKIKDWVIAFAKSVGELWNGLAKQAEKLNGELAQLKDEVTIDDAEFIKNLGVISTDANADFKTHAEFSNKVMGLFANKSLLQRSAELLKSDEIREIMASRQDVADFLAREIFTVSSVSEKNDETLVYSPKLIGGTQLSLRYSTDHEGVNDLGRYVFVVSTDKVETSAPSTIKGPKTAAAREHLQLIAKWEKNIKEFNKAVDELDRVQAQLKPSDGTLAKDGLSVYMKMISQLTTVLAPSVIRNNIHVSRKYIAFVKKALVVSKGDAPKESDSRSVVAV